MHLRTLTLRGFKSFASATTLHLEPGITCVVGPNGPGKSNVVDALAGVMSADPEERRGFIAEAAGVLKHRKRKERVLRNLDAMSTNLWRLTDLTAEIRRQLGPLARQADAARRAQVVQADVRHARARLQATAR